MHTNILFQISVAIVVATLFGIIARWTRQPVILGYIAAGVVLGQTEGLGWITTSEIEPISELGLILLLFMIGLEIDLKKLKRAGTPVLAAGVGQFAICVILGLIVMPMLGFKYSAKGYAPLYLSVAAALSSTMIVVKLLYDKSELDTAPGRVTLGLQRNGRTARLTVRDTGIGIPGDALPHVFERFFRADPARSRDPGGTGLGLSIARWIGTQHGGDVELSSRLGVGTTAVQFTASLP